MCFLRIFLYFQPRKLLPASNNMWSWKCLHKNLVLFNVFWVLTLLSMELVFQKKLYLACNKDVFQSWGIYTSTPFYFFFLKVKRTILKLAQSWASDTLLCWKQERCSLTLSVCELRAHKDLARFNRVGCPSFFLVCWN